MEVYDAEVESIAVSVATSLFEERFNADVKDVSRPALARRAGLTDWPGFDLLSERPENANNPAQTLAIEVKGRRAYGGIEVSDNEWAKACNLRSQYWLYVVFDCATAHPRLVRICDPFGKLAHQEPRVDDIRGLSQGVGGGGRGMTDLQENTDHCRT